MVWVLYYITHIHLFSWLSIYFIFQLEFSSVD